MNLCQRRVCKNAVFSFFVFLSGFTVLAILALGLSLIFFKGYPALSLSFFLEPMAKGGLEGGIFFQIIGTGILVLTTLAIVLPLAISVALLRSVYLKNHPFLKKIWTLLLYILNGTPSILFGVFGYFLFVHNLRMGKSWLTGGILLAMMILPTCSLALAEGMERVSSSYLENGLSLGLTRSQIIRTILIPQSLSSFVSGLLLGIARIAGETAPLMFTATIFSGATLPTGFKDSPILSLPYHVFTLVQQSFMPQASINAWGSALVLVAGVSCFSLCALPFRQGLHDEAQVA